LGRYGKKNKAARSIGLHANTNGSDNSDRHRIWPERQVDAFGDSPRIFNTFLSVLVSTKEKAKGCYLRYVSAIGVIHGACISSGFGECSTSHSAMQQSALAVASRGNEDSKDSSALERLGRCWRRKAKGL
jgi:hypothetical protein